MKYKLTDFMEPFIQVNVNDLKTGDREKTDQYLFLEKN